jgi:hypothetical protein
MILSLRSKPLGIEDRGKSALLLRRAARRASRARCYIDETEVET